MANHGRHSAATLAAFAAPCLPMAALGLPLVVHLPAFYSQSVGLDLSLVGTVFLVVKLLDIGIDPLLGAVMDRTRTRLGRFRPWMLASIVVLGLATFFVFMPQGRVGAAYLALGSLAIYVGFSIAVVAQTSWAAVLSPDYDQRSRIFGFWTTGNVIGMVLVLLLPIIVTRFGGTQADGVAAMGWFIIVLLPLTIGLAVWRTPEPAPQGASHGKLSDYADFLKRTTVRRLMLTDLLYGLAPGVTGALALFYFQFAKGVSVFQSNVLIFLYFAAGLVGAGLWSWVATKIEKHKALAVAGAIYAVAYVGVALAPAGNFPLIAASMVGVGIPFCAGQVLLRAMLADVADEDRLASGKDRTGMLFALLTATNKIGYAVALVVVYPLAWAGFDSQAARQSGEAVNMLQALFVVVPILLLLAAAAVIYGFPMNRERQTEVRRQLEARA